MARYYGREHFEACTRPPFELSDWPPWDYTPEDDETSNQQEGTMRHICPVCGSGHIKTDWEATDDNQNWWYTGHYVCLKCLTIYRASGSIRMGEPIVHAWHPACSRHGTDAVVISEEDNRHFYCVKCGRKFEVKNHKVVMTYEQPPVPPSWQQQSHERIQYGCQG